MSRRFPAGRVLAFVLLLLAVRGWRANDRSGRDETRRDRREAASEATYQSDVEEQPGVAVAILVDTSTSMRDDSPGDGRPKYVVAREALGTMLTATKQFVERRPDFPVKVGIYSFNSRIHTVRRITTYDEGDVRHALEDLPRPGGDTAIGSAMREARADLYRAGLTRKHLLVVTDGENRRGPAPDDVAREIARRSEGAVRINFIAFDTDPQKFAFLTGIGGMVVPAGNSAELLGALNTIYQGKILAEAPEESSDRSDRADAEKR